jgi:hypothetical protein
MNRLSHLLPLALLASTPACVDSFKGSNVQIDLSPGAPIQVSPGATPQAGEFPANTHYALYAVQNTVDDQGTITGDTLYQLTTFEVHPIVNLSSPCFIDVGEHVPHPGLHVSQFAAQIAKDTGISDIANPPPDSTAAQQIDAATAIQRQMNVAALASASGIRAITSASAGTYPAVAAKCVVDDPGGDPTLIPPPTCTDDESNKQRLTVCEAAWSASGSAGPNYFEGTDRILTLPLNGTTYGVVTGRNPINLAPVGGSQFFVPQVLDNVDAFAIYVAQDGSDDLVLGTPVDPGTLAYYGKPTFDTRGVAHVHLTSPLSTQLTADMAVFSNLDQDNVHF